MTQAAVPEAARTLCVAAVTPFTTIDFPGGLSAVVFVQGCPWKCIYCHNAWMQKRGRGFVPWSDVTDLLKRRAKLLDAVVFSGGEPCIDPMLESAMSQVRAMGYKVGLHTSGAAPRRMREVLHLADWVGMDVKADPTDTAAYDKIAGIKGACAAFHESFEALQCSGRSFEMRTTVHPSWLTEEALEKLAQWLEEKKVSTWAIQIFHATPETDPDIDPVVNAWPSEEFLARQKSRFENFIVRRA